MIGSIGAYSTTQTSSATAYKVASTAEQVSNATGNQGTSGTQPRSTQTISTLARQLADSASRAAERDQTLSRSELADKAKSMLSQITGDAYFANKARHDSEVPKTNDPELLARAKQATEFLNDSASGGHSVKNPFAGLSPEQLTNIIYDDSGTYTVNERRAAWAEAYDQRQAWKREVVAQGQMEYNSTGKMTNFFQSVLDYYNQLPLIEQAQYPMDYAVDLQRKIDLDFNYRTHQAEGKSEDPLSLFELLLENTKQPNNQITK